MGTGSKVLCKSSLLGIVTGAFVPRSSSGDAPARMKGKCTVLGVDNNNIILTVVYHVNSNMKVIVLLGVIAGSLCTRKQPQGCRITHTHTHLKIPDNTHRFAGFPADARHLLGVSPAHSRAPTYTNAIDTELHLEGVW